MDAPTGAMGQGAYLRPLNPYSVRDATVGRPQKHEGVRLVEPLSTQASHPHPTPLPTCRANPVWLDPFCRNLELAAQAEHEDDLPENLSEIADLWNSPTRTHVSQARARGGVDYHAGQGGGRLGLCQHRPRSCFLGGGPLPCVCMHTPPQVQLTNILCPQGTFGREPAAVRPDDDRYLRAAIQEYDSIARLGQVIREGPIKVSPPCRVPQHPRPQRPTPRPPPKLGPAPKDTGRGESRLRLQVQLDLPSAGARTPEQEGAWALGLTGSCFSPRCPQDQGATESCRQALLLTLYTRVRGLGLRDS